ncbi:MAG: hypothetical protein VX890_04390, partial [Pseudomonadota bacterium]|nr:hypothetical protein [Pseudomonadota bacterium]
MNKLVTLILVILFLAYVPLGPINYSSELSGFFIFLGGVQVTLSSIISHLFTYITEVTVILFNNTLPFLAMVYDSILSLPYEKINYWYVLLGLFVVSFFAEKFRTINNDLSKLNKRISMITSNTLDNNKNNESSLIEVKKLSEKSEAILELLSVISNAAENFKNTHARSKKIRRAISENTVTTSNPIQTGQAKDEDQLMRLRKDQTLQENKVEIASNVDSIDSKETGQAKDEDQLMRLRKDQTLEV